MGLSCHQSEQKNRKLKTISLKQVKTPQNFLFAIVQLQTVVGLMVLAAENSKHFEEKEKLIEHTGGAKETTKRLQKRNESCMFSFANGKIEIDKM